MGAWRLPKELAEALSVLPPERWRVENGSKHFKIKIDNRLIGITSKDGRRDEGSQRTMKNALAQIRRAIRQGATVNG
jgi:hypothetical protein